MRRYLPDGRPVTGGPKLGVGHHGELVDDRTGDAQAPAPEPGKAAKSRKAQRKAQRKARRRNRD